MRGTGLARITQPRNTRAKQTIKAYKKKKKKNKTKQNKTSRQRINKKQVLNTKPSDKLRVLFLFFRLVHRVFLEKALLFLLIRL